MASHIDQSYVFAHAKKKPYLLKPDSGIEQRFFFGFRKFCLNEELQDFQLIVLNTAPDRELNGSRKSLDMLMGPQNQLVQLVDDSQLFCHIYPTVQRTPGLSTMLLTPNFQKLSAGIENKSASCATLLDTPTEPGLLKADIPSHQYSSSQEGNLYFAAYSHSVSQGNRHD